MKITIHDYQTPMLPLEHDPNQKSAYESYIRREFEQKIDQRMWEYCVINVFNEVDDWEKVRYIDSTEKTRITIHTGEGDFEVKKYSPRDYLIYTGVAIANNSDFRLAIERVVNYMVEVQDQQFYVGGDMFQQEIKNFTKGAYMETITNLQSNLHTSKNNVDEYRILLTRNIRDVERYTNDLKKLEQDDANYETKIIKELEALTSNKKIKNVGFKKGKFLFETNDIMIHEPFHDRYYDGGEYQVSVGLLDSDVKIKGNKKVHGMWTEEDPHPHVDGGHDAPCLGNVANSIAELCGQNELYGLAMVIISFLESANIEDSAGRMVPAWDQIDPETGEIIEEGHRPRDEDDYMTCEECGYEGDEDYFTRVGDQYICEDCYDNITTTCYECDERNYTQDMVESASHDGLICESHIEELGMHYDEALGGYVNEE